MSTADRPPAIDSMRLFMPKVDCNLGNKDKDLAQSEVFLGPGTAGIDGMDGFIIAASGG